MVFTEQFPTIAGTYMWKPIEEEAAACDVLCYFDGIRVFFGASDNVGMLESEIAPRKWAKVD